MRHTHPARPGLRARIGAVMSGHGLIRPMRRLMAVLKVEEAFIDSAKFISKKVQHRPDMAATVEDVFSLWREVVPHLKCYDGPLPARLPLAFPYALLQGLYHGELMAWKESVQGLIKLLQADTGQFHAQPTSYCRQNVRAQKVACVIQESKNRRFVLLH